MAEKQAILPKKLLHNPLVTSKMMAAAWPKVIYNLWTCGYKSVGMYFIFLKIILEPISSGTNDFVTADISAFYFTANYICYTYNRESRGYNVKGRNT